MRIATPYHLVLMMSVVSSALCSNGFIHTAAAAPQQAVTADKPSSADVQQTVPAQSLGDVIQRLPPTEPEPCPRGECAVKNSLAASTVPRPEPCSIPIAQPIRPAHAPASPLLSATGIETAVVQPNVNRATFMAASDASPDRIFGGTSSADAPLTEHELAALQLPEETAIQAAKMMAEATRLADRGALFAARNRFLRVMRMVTQTLDAQAGRSYHTRALARGLRALEEAGDFASSSDFVEADLHLAGFVAGHDTPVLKNVDASNITPLTAMQAYYDYAHGQLVRASASKSIASQALFAMGRAESLIGSKQGSRVTGPKAMALFNAALAVDQTNARAANELAVMLDRAGHSQRAVMVLEHMARTSPSAAVLQNLASLYQRTGRHQQARGVLANQRQLAGVPGALKASSIAGRPQIHWVSPKAFTETPSAVEPVSHSEPAIIPRPPLPRKAAMHAPRPFPAAQQRPVPTKQSAKFEANGWW